MFREEKLAEDDICEIASSLYTAEEERELFVKLFESNEKQSVQAIKSGVKP
jgi:hypothetical protein